MWRWDEEMGEEEIEKKGKRRIDSGAPFFSSVRRYWLGSNKVINAACVRSFK